MAKKHSHKHQQIGVRGGKQQHGCAPQKGIQQHGLAAAQQVHAEASHRQKHQIADVAHGDDLGQLGGTQLEVGREDGGKNAPHGIVCAQTHHQDQERSKSNDVLFLIHWFIPQKKPPPSPTRQKGPEPMRRLAQYFQMAQPSWTLSYSGVAASAVRPMVCTLVQFWVRRPCAKSERSSPAKPRVEFRMVTPSTQRRNTAALF